MDDVICSNEKHRLQQKRFFCRLIYFWQGFLARKVFFVGFLFAQDFFVILIQGRKRVKSNL